MRVSRIRSVQSDLTAILTTNTRATQGGDTPVDAVVRAATGLIGES